MSVTCGRNLDPGSCSKNRSGCFQVRQSLNARVLDTPSLCCAQMLSHVRLFATPRTSPPASSVHGFPQARVLWWVAIPFSRGSSLPRARTRTSCMSCIGESLPLAPPGNSTASQGSLQIQRDKCDHNLNILRSTSVFRLLVNMFSSFLKGTRYEIQYFCHAF